MNYNKDYIQDYFATAEFFYYYGLNSRLIHNLSVIGKKLDKLTHEQQSRYHFLMAIAQLREMQIDEALQSMRKAHNLKETGDYVNSLIEILNNRTPISIEDFIGKRLSFSRLNTHNIADIALEQDGKFIGLEHPNERSWAFEDGILVFKNYRNERTSLFFGSLDGASLAGPFLNGNVIHALQVIIDE